MNIEQVFPFRSVNEHNGLSTLTPEVETHETSPQPLNAKDIGKIETNYLEQQDSALCKGCDPIETLSTALRSQSSTSNYERDGSEEDSDDSDDSDEEEDMHFRRKRICLAEKKALDLDSNKEAKVETLASYIERKALDNNSGKYVDNALTVNSDNTITVKNSHVDVRSNPPPPAKFFMSTMGVYPIMPSHNIFMQPYGMPSGQSLGYIPSPPVDTFNKLNTDFSIAEDKQVGEQIRINISKVQARKTENIVNKKNTVYLSKVPRKINSMEALSAIFKKFGTILNLNIDIRKNMAQIEYKSELEAQKAIVMCNKLKGSLFSDNDVIISKTSQIETQVGNQKKQKSKLTAEAVQNILTSKIRELLQERSKQEDKTVFDEKITKVKDLMSRLRKDPVVEKFEDDLEEIGVSLN